VVHLHGRLPYTGAVAVFADVGADDVLERFTGGGYTVMAGATRLSRRIMIEVRW
jgi:hypothetical protein